MTRDIQQSIDINATIEEVFDALLQPTSIMKWWGASQAIVIPENGGIYALTWGEDHDSPDYVTIASIAGMERPRTFGLVDYKYANKTGPMPFEADFSVRFTLEQQDSGTRLTVLNDGFPQDAIADEFYAGCVQGWKDTLASFQSLFVV